MGVRAGRPLVVEAVGRPKSSLAQLVTAATAVVALVVIIVMALLAVGAAQSTNTTRSVTVASVQAYCLDYTEYVLDQHRAGLTVDQIDATLSLAAQAGRSIHAQGLQLDDPQVCGRARTVLRIAGLK
jgi:hypothetical protein